MPIEKILECDEVYSMIKWEEDKILIATSEGLFVAGKQEVIDKIQVINKK